MQAKKTTYIRVPKLFANGSNVLHPSMEMVVLGDRYGGLVIMVDGYWAGEQPCYLCNEGP